MQTIYAVDTIEVNAKGVIKIDANNAYHTIASAIEQAIKVAHQLDPKVSIKEIKQDIMKKQHFEFEFKDDVFISIGIRKFKLINQKKES